MNYDPNNPLIVQGDRSILVEVDNPRYGAARDALAPFAELEKSQEHIHTYRLTPLSLSNAAAAGTKAEVILAVLDRYSKFQRRDNPSTDIAELVGRYNRVRLRRRGGAGTPPPRAGPLGAAVPRPRLPARGGRRVLRRRRRPRRQRRHRPALRRGQNRRRHRGHGAHEALDAGADDRHHGRQ